MTTRPSASATFGPAFTAPACGFTEFLGHHAPELLPGRRQVPAHHVEAPHGTTIVALVHAGGVVMAGDRRATMGNLIASRDIEKVFQTDEHSVAGIAGSAGLAIELVKLFQVELEHFEKLEGSTLSMDGKSNRLATMIRGNLPMAMQGLVVMPLFAGYDLDRGHGRIFSFDVTGGRYEESGYHSVGSGSLFAKGALKKRFRDGMTEAEAVHAAVDALYDAADDDSATGGPDLARRIWPVVMSVTDEGVRRLPDPEVESVVQGVVDARQLRPGG